MSASESPPDWVYRLTADRPGPFHELILDQLRTVIVEGAASPGAPIPVDHVANRFLVSRIPVREALKTLIGEGLVEHQPRAGYTVARLTRDELAEFYIVREALETAALREAVPRAAAADIAEAEAAHHALRHAIRTGDLRAHHREARRFHFALVAPAVMPRLQRMFEIAWNTTDLMQPAANLSVVDTTELDDEHEVMLRAFRDRDVAAMVELTASHYGRLREAVAARS